MPGPAIESKLACFGSRAGAWVGSVGGGAWDGIGGSGMQAHSHAGP